MEEEVKEITITEADIARLMRGERPEGMDYTEFRLKRKALQAWLKRYKKGRPINKEENEEVQSTVQG